MKTMNQKKFHFFLLMQFLFLIISTKYLFLRKTRSFFQKLKNSLGKTKIDKLFQEFAVILIYDDEI